MRWEINLTDHVPFQPFIIVSAIARLPRQPGWQGGRKIYICVKSLARLVGGGRRGLGGGAVEGRGGGGGGGQRGRRLDPFQLVPYACLPEAQAKNLFIL